MIKEILHFLLHINKGIGREGMFHFTFHFRVRPLRLRRMAGCWQIAPVRWQSTKPNSSGRRLQYSVSFPWGLGSITVLREELTRRLAVFVKSCWKLSQALQTPKVRRATYVCKTYSQQLAYNIVLHPVNNCCPQPLFAVVHGRQLTLIDWDRGKQYVLWTRDCRCFHRQSRGKHRQSRVHKTYCFPEVSVNKYFIIYWVSKEKKSTTNQSNMYKKDYLLPDMAPWGSVDLLFTGELKVMSTA